MDYYLLEIRDMNGMCVFSLFSSTYYLLKIDYYHDPNPKIRKKHIIDLFCALQNALCIFFHFSAKIWLITLVFFTNSHLKWKNHIRLINSLSVYGIWSFIRSCFRLKKKITSFREGKVKRDHFEQKKTKMLTEAWVITSFTNGKF